MTLNRKQLLILAVSLLVIGLGAGWLGGRRGANPALLPSAEPNPPGAPRVSLPAQALKQNKIEAVTVGKIKLARDVEVVGSVAHDANHFAQVGPLIAGRLVSIKAGIGDAVTAGQVLAELESFEVGQAQAAYLTARATSMAAQTNLRRERELAERKVSSIREKELAEAQAATEKANLAAAIQRLRALGLRPEDIRDLDRSGGRPGCVALTSPISGVVLTREVSLGQAVQPATDAFKVADLSHLWVVLELFEKDLSFVHVGQKAVLRTEVYPGRTFPARVAYLGQEIDEKTRTAPVRIEFENREGLFRPGQFVSATLVGDGSPVSREVLAVPRRAVLTVEGKPQVFVAESDGTFSRRAVELGVSGGGMVEVRSGLGLGERVATDGGFLLKSELLR